MKRTLVLKKDTLAELTSTDLAGVVGGTPPPTLYTCVKECVVDPIVATLVGGVDLPSIDVPCS